MSKSDFWSEHPHLEPSTCKSCGKKILWALSSEGKRVPLDPTPPVYELMHDGDQPRCARRRDSLVSHFGTCPHANRHSASNKRPPAKCARVELLGNTYDHRQELRALGWQWDGQGRVWYQDVEDERIDEVCAEAKELEGVRPQVATG